MWDGGAARRRHFRFIRHNCGGRLAPLTNKRRRGQCRRGPTRWRPPMSLDADMIVDRRRMRRKLTFWRVTAGLFARVAVVGTAALVTRSGTTGVAAGRDTIARVKVTGLIRNDQDRVDSLERLAKASTVKAVIVRIDSPGGTTAGSEQLHNA